MLCVSFLSTFGSAGAQCMMGYIAGLVTISCTQTPSIENVHSFQCGGSRSAHLLASAFYGPLSMSYAVSLPIMHHKCCIGTHQAVRTSRDTALVMLCCQDKDLRSETFHFVLRSFGKMLFWRECIFPCSTWSGHWEQTQQKNVYSVL